ncbi:hypothetical protein BSZ35_02420 [Salinibacter sp. 10B]|uniref:hypothetical protein n=1 Tax=Salinibacter sp. 10B TaxID=1923971 RepID=UPI000CF5056E|nr:hypothetical protein [Salinibacter sp. 10B]PQJ33604.1 hypothetical protein BSZ35_02420 [Salinibacter sp. 10B]
MNDFDEWNEWLGKRGDGPVPTIMGSRYFSDPSRSPEQWRRDTMEFVKEVEAEAEQIFEDDGIRGLREERDLIEEHVQSKLAERNQVSTTSTVYHLMRTSLGRYDETDLVAEDVPSGPSAATVTIEDGEYWGPFVLRPTGTASRIILELSLPELKMHNLPTDQQAYLDLGVELAEDATWKDAERAVREKIDQWKEVWKKKDNRLAYYQARLGVYENLLERRAMGKSMPWETSDEDTEDAELRRKLSDDSARLEWIGEYLNPKRNSEGWTWEDCYQHYRDLCDDLDVECSYSSADSMARSYRQYHKRNGIDQETE